jgi:hypothetical protein
LSSDFSTDSTLEARRLRWAIDAYSRSMAALLHNRDFSQFADDVCQSIINETYVLAWIGLAEPAPAKAIRMLAVAGPAAAYCRDMALSWDETQLSGKGATGRAIRT